MPRDYEFIFKNMEAFASIASAFGLSTTAGLNAYLPLLVVSLMAKFTSLITLNPPWNELTNWWVIGILIVLLIIELVVDKIPAVDTVNDIIQTVIRPVAGAILFTSSSGVLGQVNPVLTIIVGLLLAGGVHAIKATARPLVTATTAGVGNWVVSSLENISALTASILSILIPIIIAIIILFIILIMALIIWRWRKRRRRVAK
jgi:hypothetical protein